MDDGASQGRTATGAREKVTWFPSAARIFAGSDAAETKWYYGLLAKSGAVGEIAVCLFRAQKCSSRAKKYRGGIRGVGSFRSLSYGRKSWSISELCQKLAAHPECGITFGWKKEGDGQIVPEWIIYVDLPEGQVSFHSTQRYEGPDYPGEWDRQRKSEERILKFCDRVCESRLSVTT